MRRRCPILSDKFAYTTALTIKRPKKVALFKFQFLDERMETEINEIDAQLTPAELRRITEESDLKNVRRINLSIDTERVTLSELGNHLVNLVELKLETPSYVPTLRKFGTLQNLKVLWASAVGLENIDGTSGLTSLTELYIR